ncbi:MAG: hypothetical protein DUD39_18490 [Coriobacteriaceae bacterium]|nr:MAG: hypothetical protein DUD39_18490 [Coriobacteriaceae bacterium]
MDYAEPLACECLERLVVSHAPCNAGIVVPPEALLRPREGVAAEYEEVLERLVAFMGALL